MNSPIPSRSTLKPGDRVFATVQGAFADKVCAKVSRVVRLPDCMPYDQGAGALLNSGENLADIVFPLSGLHVTYGTTYEALFGRAELKAS